MSGPGGRRVGAALLAVWCVAAVPRPASGQDLDPRAYSPSPIGAAFLVGVLSRSTGAVVTDPVLPVSDIEARIKGAVAGFGYTFGLAGKLALVTAAMPYAWGDVSGKVFEDARTVTRAGPADLRAKLSVNLRGNPAMGAVAFSKAPQKTVVGVSVTLQAPTGEYDGTKLINLGNHRWAFRPEVGMSMPRGRWDFDAYVGVWMFTDNADYFPGGARREQEPLTSVQGHASYTFRPRLWVAVNATWYGGGAAQVNGGEPLQALSNSRLGATLSLPVSRGQSLKVAYSGGMIVRTGTSFRTLSLGWQKVWLTKR